MIIAIGKIHYHLLCPSQRFQRISDVLHVERLTSSFGVCRRPNVSWSVWANCHNLCCRNLVLHVCVALDMLSNGYPHFRLMM